MPILANYLSKYLKKCLWLVDKIDLAKVVFITLTMLSTQANARLLFGSFNYHFDKTANGLYEGRVSDDIHFSPLLGKETDKSVLFVGGNSIHQPIAGGFYKLDYGFVLGAYVQDTSLFKKRGIKFYLNSDVVPIVGFNYSFKHVGVVVSPAMVNVYFRL